MLTQDQANKLCSESIYFTWEDIEQTAVALTNLYLYQDKFNAKYYNDFMNVLQIEDDMNTYLYGSSSGYNTFFNQAQQDLKTSQYADFCTTGVETNTKCAFSAFTNNQWLDASILKNPLPGQEVISTAYNINYAKYTQNWVSPEYGFWRDENDEYPLDPADYEEALEQTYYAFNVSGLFNGKKFQDVLLYSDKTPNYLPSFDTYLRFVTINFGLTGLVAPFTPRQVIEGYTDPLVATLNETPLYMGGDNTTAAFLSLNDPPTHPKDNIVAFFTGEGSSDMTRTYGRWLD